MKKPRVERIAITGMACRLPGAASLADFWALLSAGGSATRQVPASRWNADAVFDRDPKAPGKTNNRTGGFIDDIERFDAAFFGISPREATQMDPQQRILLELAYEALEDAGVTPAAVAGSDTAVFVGAMTNDYFRQQLADQYQLIDVHTGSGAGLCMLANRLSYQFDLHGPSASIDTACSSSLVAVFQACQSLWTGQSRLALAAGVNVMLDPALNVFYAKAGLSAPDGKCKTFAAGADGIGRAEGAAVIVLKRLSDAIADKDPIYAVIRGGAVNHDGRSNGLTQPNRWAQEQVLRRAFEHAEIDPAELSYVELHGTGTLIGDPIEANALSDVLGEKSRRKDPCFVGSVKTNFGHLEAAAGIAGLVKVALSIHHGMIPPSLWFDAPNPYIPFHRIPLRVNTELRPWHVESGRRLGAVSSFGLGGTNANLVLEASPYTYTPAKGSPQATGHCLFISARSEPALRQLARAYVDFLSTIPECSLPSVCSSALRHKGVHGHRLTVLGTDRAGVLEGLGSFLEKVEHAGVLYGHARPTHRKVLIGVAEPTRVEAHRDYRNLLDAPLARDAWNACRESLCRQGLGALPALDDVASRSKPPAIKTNGHADGRHSLRQARLTQFCAQYALLKQLIGGIGSDNIEAIAAVGVSELAALCASNATTLDLALRWVCADELRAFTLQEELPAGKYAVDCIFPAGRNPPLTAIDCAPGSFDCAPWAAKANADLLMLDVQSLTEEARGLHRLFAHLASRYSLNWPVWAPDLGFIRLPAYPWQRESFWLRPAAADFNHALLGRRIQSSDAQPRWVWERQLSASELPYLADHRVQGAIVLPGAGFVELALAAHREISGESSVALQGLEFHKALAIDPREPLSLRVTFNDGSRELNIYSRRRAEDQWTLHSSGILPAHDESQAQHPDLEALQSRCRSFISKDAHYENMQQRGFEYGPWFQGVRQLWADAGGENVLAWIEGHAPLAGGVSRHALHPTLLDSSLQALLHTLKPGDDNSYIPVGVSQLTLRHTPTNGFWCYGGLSYLSPGVIEGNFVLFDTEGRVIAEGRGIRARALPRRASADLEDMDDWLYTFLWQEQPQRARQRNGGRWLLVSNDAAESKRLVEHLQAAGLAQVTALTPPDARTVLSALESSKDAGFDGVLYAPNRGAQDSDPDIDELLSLAELFPVLERAGHGKPPPLVVLTHRGQSVWPAEPATVPSQLPFVGLARVAMNEYPQLRVRAIDIDEDIATVANLAAQIMEDSAEEEMALRRDRTFVNRLARRPAREWHGTVAPPLLPIRSDGTYLITGGFGGFGLEVAGWLVSKGARHLVLVGRSGASSPAAQQTVASLRDAGAQVLEISADISNETAVQDLVARAQSQLPALRGIFHAAAVLDDAPIAHLTRAQVESALAAKARGAWHLHRCTCELPLEQFVMFSSMASMVGHAGQASYVMACAYLDALAHYRRARQLPAMSIHWGALAEVGMLTRQPDVASYLRRSGVGLLEPRQALQLLDKTLHWNPIEIGIAIVDWRTWAQLNRTSVSSPKYAGLLDTAAPASTQGPQSNGHAGRFSGPAEQREPAVLQFLVDSLSRALQLAPEKIDLHLPLPSLGMDSLSALDLRSDIETQMSIKVPMRELMKQTTLSQLAHYIVGLTGSADPMPQPDAKRYRIEEIDIEDAESVLGKIEGFADEDVERLLAELTSERRVGE